MSNNEKLNPLLAIFDKLAEITTEMATQDRDWEAMLNAVDELMVLTIQMKEVQQPEGEMITAEEIQRPLPIEINYELGRWIWTFKGEITLTAKEVL